jgi:hypothetical protein
MSAFAFKSGSNFTGRTSGGGCSTCSSHSCSTCGSS